MSNSSLVSYTKISPNSNNPRNHVIDKITIHHMAGNMSIEALGNMWANPAREASSNYGIGSDGRIGMYVEEKNRSWCSSSSSNDNRAITIEVANDGGAPDWHVSDKAMASLIDLCVDICKRNNIKKLNFTGNASGNLTQHNYFAATACPGPYLKSKFQYIADTVNSRLNAGANPNPPVGSFTVKTLANDVAIYNEPKDGASKVGETGKGVFTIVEVNGHYGKFKSGAGWIDISAANVDSPNKGESGNTFSPYMVRLAPNVTSVNIRSGAGPANAITGVISDGTYTIVDEAKSPTSSSMWGKLKSGAGWVCLDYFVKV